MGDLISKVKNTICVHNLIKKGDHIVVGVSGGPDSVCLLFILNSLTEEMAIKLTAVHINHMLRGEDADKDEQFTKEFCKKINVPCVVFIFDIPKLSKEWKMTSEETGRKARYDSFYDVMKKENANKLAIAQNQNDQAETLMMRIMRGTGIDGLAGIDYIREIENHEIKGQIIRPLLDIPGSEIRKYCDENNLNPAVDITNNEPIYTRNKIRLELFPLIEENFNSNFVPTIVRMAEGMKEDKDFILAEVERVLSENLKEIDSDNMRLVLHKKAFFKTNRPSKKKELISLHPSIAKRLIVRCFARIGLVKDIATVHIMAGLKLIETNRTNAQIDFPSGYLIVIGYEDIIFKKGTKNV